MTSLIREFSIGYSSYVLCTECDEQWIDTDYVWVGAPRNNRCTDCFSFEEEDSMGDSS